MQIGDRFHECQTQPRSFSTARRINLIEAIEYLGNVLRANAAARIRYNNFRPCGIGGERNGDAAAVWRKADGVIDEVADRPSKQNRIREDLAFALTVDLEVSLGRDRFIIRRNFFDRGPAIKS